MKTYVAILRHNNVPAMEEQGTATLDVLPHTVLAEIASRCSPRDACALSLVSRPLRAAVSGNDYFWGACVSRRWGKGRTPRDGDGREPRNDFHSRHSRAAGWRGPAPPGTLIWGVPHVLEPGRERLATAGVVPQAQPGAEPAAFLRLEPGGATSPGCPGLLLGGMGPRLLLCSLREGGEWGPACTLPPLRSVGRVTAACALMDRRVVAGTEAGSVHCVERQAGGDWARPGLLSGGPKAPGPGIRALVPLGPAAVAAAAADGTLRILPVHPRRQADGAPCAAVLRGHPTGVAACAGVGAQGWPGWVETGAAAPERIMSLDDGGMALLWDTRQGAAVTRWKPAAQARAVYGGLLVGAGEGNVTVAVTVEGGARTVAQALDARDRRGHVLMQCPDAATVAAGHGWSLALGGAAAARDGPHAACAVWDLRGGSSAVGRGGPRLVLEVPKLPRMCTELCMDRHKIVAACVARTVRALRSPRGVVCVWGPETGRLRHCLPTLPADTIRQMGGDGASTSPAGQEIGAPSGVQGVEEEAAPVPEWALLWPRSRDVEERLGLTPEEHAVSLSETPMALAAHGPVIACATAHGAVTAWNFDECVRQTGPLEGSSYYESSDGEGDDVDAGEAGWTRFWRASDTPVD